MTSHASEPGSGVTVHRTWIPLFLTALIIGAAFTAVYLGIQRDPVPDRLPLAVVGQELAGRADASFADKASIRPVSTVADGEDLVRNGDVVGVVALTAVRTISLHYAGSSGLSESGAAQQLVGRFASAAGLTVAAQDIVPLGRYDERGLAAFYVVFGVTLASFLLSQLLSSGGAVFGRLRHRFAVMLGFTLVIGLVAAGISGPVYSALTATFVELAASLMLLSAAVAFATAALAATMGPPGISVAVLIFTVVGNATSGASIGFHLLPGWARAISAELPNGAAFRLINDFGYYNGAHAWSSAVVLLMWTGVGAVVVIAAQRVAERRRRHPKHLRASDSEPGMTDGSSVIGPQAAGGSAGAVVR